MPFYYLLPSSKTKYVRKNVNNVNYVNYANVTIFAILICIFSTDIFCDIEDNLLIPYNKYHRMCLVIAVLYYSTLYDSNLKRTQEK